MDRAQATRKGSGDGRKRICRGEEDNRTWYIKGKGEYLQGRHSEKRLGREGDCS